ncbi:hypothetical protein OG272_13435 [Streptomyces sp. NBC_00104]|uniref:hypothetical protein n=1 Tax=Streptomyces sp. NBC_00104 TaxID=2903621 RepID=UPI00324F9218
MTTVQLELVGLAFSGLVALAGWPFGWLPDPGLVALMTGITASGPAAELYRAGRPPRRRAVVSALLAPAAVTPLVAAATNWALPAAADPGIGLVVGYVVALPVGVAVLDRLLGGAKTG